MINSSKILVYLAVFTAVLEHKVQCSNEEGGIDMCQAIIDMIEEGREEGIEKIIMVMLSKGYDRMLISQMTDISIDTINKWAEN